MNKPLFDLSRHEDEAFYAFVGRVSLLLVEENVDAITATMFLRELVEAGGSILAKEEAMVLAQNYVTYRPDRARRNSLGAPGSD